MPLSSFSADVPLFVGYDIGTWKIGMQGNGMTSIEAPVGEINDVCVVRKSGLIFMALDSPRIPSFFIPSLGPAPRWCSFLENLTVRQNPIFAFMKNPYGFVENLQIVIWSLMSISVLVSLMFFSSFWI
jgi:hypothetical protein